MTAPDYGPIPVSRLKEESGGLFTALDSGRRVLISRHGQVVATIEPASVERHAAQLASFALSSREVPVPELSATDLGQGSPSESIRRAEEGVASLVTRNNKVYGVLTAPRATESLAVVDEQERALARFEREHPGASAQEFAALVEDLSSGGSGEHSDEAKGAHPEEVSDVGQLQEPEAGALVDALLDKGVALEEAQDFDRAADVFRLAIRRFKTHPDDGVRRKVARSMVELAKLYASGYRPQDAVQLADEAMLRLGLEAT